MVDVDDPNFVFGGIFGVVITFLISLCFVASICNECNALQKANKDLQIYAIKHKYAEYTINDNGEPVFSWKEKQ